MSTPRDIIDFWFEGVGDADRFDTNKNPFRKWFTKNERFDDAVRDYFEEDLVRGASGELDSWGETPAGRLALILIFDQFSRNMYRGTAQAFATDPLALDLSRRSLSDGFDRKLPLIQRVFVYLPLMHSENLPDQHECVRQFESLVRECRERYPANTAYFESNLTYARRHRDIIARFGRFPHRNTVLTRPSTEEEQRFLTERGSSF